MAAAVKVDPEAGTTYIGLSYKQLAAPDKKMIDMEGICEKVAEAARVQGYPFKITPSMTQETLLPAPTYKEANQAKKANGRK